MSSGNASIGAQAPDFSTTAVVNGDFAENFSMSQFKDRANEFKELGCEVLACSTDSHFSHLAWTQQSRKQGGIGDMNIPLLADTNHDIGKKYGVMIPDAGICYRGLFIIDKAHNLRQITINDLPVGRSVDEILRLVKAFQFVDEHGEVCPANWQPGKDTIKTSVKESKEFFSKQ